MPQISQIDSFVSQIFWLFLSFGIIYFYISKIAGPKLTNIILRRQNIITSDIETAEKANEDAEKSKVEFETKLELSRKTASDIISKASQEIIEKNNSEISSVENEIRQQLEKSEIEISSAKKSVEENLNSQIVDFVQEILVKIAGAKVEKEIIAKHLEK